MSFVSSLFGGGGGGDSGAAWQQNNAITAATNRANTLQEAMLEEQHVQTEAARVESERLKTIETTKQLEADNLKATDDQRRQQRLAGGGLQRFMTSGYTGYGDSRPFGTATALGG